MYELVDFGNGRKLERIAGRLLDRPSPPADGLAPKMVHWPDTDAVFVADSPRRGVWHRTRANDGAWTANLWFGNLELKCSPFGHIGFFPEQCQNWNWIRSMGQQLDGMRLLNLFAYTGGSTLAALACGAQVTHVDSAKNTVDRARGNAASSGLIDRPVRWIVEDAMRFVGREIRRGNRYDGVILDPPSFGQGVSKGQQWQIARDLPNLLEGIGKLVPQCRMMLCTCHSPGFSAHLLSGLIQDRLPAPACVRAAPMQLTTRDGRNLHSGYCVRWFANFAAEDDQPQSAE